MGRTESINMKETQENVEQLLVDNIANLSLKENELNKRIVNVIKLVTKEIKNELQRNSTKNNEKQNEQTVNDGNNNERNTQINIENSKKPPKDAKLSEKKRVKRYRCGRCGEESSSEDLMRKHVSSHKLKNAPDLVIKRKFRCGVCGESSSSEAKIREHVQTHNPPKTPKLFKCHNCKKCFNQLAKLIIHRHIHNGENMFELCTVCKLRVKDLFVHNMINHS